jgi:restriction system protein
LLVAIPDFQTLMLPVLELAADGKEHSIKDARELLAQKFKLTDQERKTLLASGQQPVFDNRVAWAKSYLQQAGALNSHRRGHFQIAQRGEEILRNAPERITIKYLEQFPEFVQFRYATSKEKEEPTATNLIESTGQTPQEALETAYIRLRKDVTSELLVRVKKASPVFFERLVVELLLKMGYGGSRSEAGEAIGSSGDEGIDGIINEDRLGLDVVYLQAKSWEGNVGGPEIQKFVGALHGKRAKKGVFITTSGFSPDALEYVSKIDPKVVLIDGVQLSELMIDFNVGVASVSTYETKRIDSDYFGEE